jgi:hypothetical protein
MMIFQRWSYLDDFGAVFQTLRPRPQNKHTHIYIIIHIYIYTYLSMGVSNKNGATILFTPQIPVVSSPMSSLRQSQEGLIRSKHKSDKACGCRDLVKQNSRRYVVAKAPSRYKGVFSNPWRIRGAAIYDDMDPINIPHICQHIYQHHGSVMGYRYSKHLRWLDGNSSLNESWGALGPSQAPAPGRCLVGRTKPLAGEGGRAENGVSVYTGPVVYRSGPWLARNLVFPSLKIKGGHSFLLL